MTDELKQENTVQAENTQQVVAQNETEESPPIKSEENKVNWAQVREQRAAERKARIEAEQRAKQKEQEAEALKAALEAAVGRMIPQQQQYNYEQEESEEQRIEKKIAEALKKERQRYEEEIRQREMQEYPTKIQRDFPDFQMVCSEENVDYLEYHYPEVATPYKYMPDGYEKWSAIYKAVKKFVPNPNSKKEEKKIDKNLSKPGSISSVGTTQKEGGAPVPFLTEEMKRANWEKMKSMGARI